MISLAGFGAVAESGGGVCNEERRTAPAFLSKLKARDVKTSGGALGSAAFDRDNGNGESFEKGASVPVNRVSMTSAECPVSNCSFILGKYASGILIDGDKACTTAVESRVAAAWEVTIGNIHLRCRSLDVKIAVAFVCEFDAGEVHALAKRCAESWCHLGIIEGRLKKSPRRRDAVSEAAN